MVQIISTAYGRAGNGARSVCQRAHTCLHPGTFGALTPHLPQPYFSLKRAQGPFPLAPFQPLGHCGAFVWALIWFKFKRF
jgi:hypothetical protein